MVADLQTNCSGCGIKWYFASFAIKSPPSIRARSWVSCSSLIEYWRQHSRLTPDGGYHPLALSHRINNWKCSLLVAYWRLLSSLLSLACRCCILNDKTCANILSGFQNQQLSYTPKADTSWERTHFSDCRPSPTYTLNLGQF